MVTDTGALFSPCKKFRYKLWRTWGRGPKIAFIMLNPSTADEVKNDPTVERCQRRAMAMHYEGLMVANIFALRSTDPRELYKAKDPIGPDNNAMILEVAAECDKIVCAWGTHGALNGRGKFVVDTIAKWFPFRLYHLGLTSGGFPRHPLYVSYKVEPQPFEPPY